VLPLKSPTLAMLADALDDAGNMALIVALFFGYPAVLVGIAYRAVAAWRTAGSRHR